MLLGSGSVKEIEANSRQRGFGNGRRRPSELTHDCSPYMQLGGITTECFKNPYTLLEINFKHLVFSSGLGPANSMPTIYAA